MSQPRATKKPQPTAPTGEQPLTPQQQIERAMASMRDRAAHLEPMATDETGDETGDDEVTVTFFKDQRIYLVQGDDTDEDYNDEEEDDNV